jgi:hypothetical protein
MPDWSAVRIDGSKAPSNNVKLIKPQWVQKTQP